MAKALAPQRPAREPGLACRTEAMSNKADPADPALDEARAQLREGLDNAKKLVERTRFLLNGEPDPNAAYLARGPVTRDPA